MEHADNEASHTFDVASPKYWWDDARDTRASTGANKQHGDPSDPSYRLPVLDIRDEREHALNRIERPQERNGGCRTIHSSSYNALCVVHIPLHFLPDRNFELPARHLPFAVLAQDDKELLQLQQIMSRRRKKRKRNVPNSKSSKSAKGEASSSNDGQEKQPAMLWKVPYVMLGDDPMTWAEVKELGLHATGSTECNNDSAKQDGGGPHKPHPVDFPFPRLWQPDPMVANVLVPLLQKDYAAFQSRASCRTGHASVTTNKFEIWDLASGAGRDVAYVAETIIANGNVPLSHNGDGPSHDQQLSVVAIDHRYRKDADIEQLTSFFERRGVASAAKYACLDASNWMNVETNMLAQHNSEASRDANATTASPSSSSLPLSHLHAIYCVRFWKPELVRSIATATKETSLRIGRGTIFAISHFCKPTVGAAWDFAHPSEKTVLERHQLRDLFASAWEILHDEIAMDSDHGRTMIHFVARKL